MYNDIEYENLSKMIEYGNYSLFEEEVKQLLDNDATGNSIILRKLYFNVGPQFRQIIVRIFSAKRKEKLHNPTTGLYSEKTDLINDLVESFKSSKNKKNYYVVCPTGWGKTTFTEGLIDKLYSSNNKRRFLFIVSRNNALLEQTASRFIFPDMVRVYGNSENWEKQNINDARVVIASLQTVVGRRKKDNKLVFSIKDVNLHPSRFSLIIIDEIHNFIDNFGERYLDYKQEQIVFNSRNTFKLGLTATPYQGVVGREKYVRDITCENEIFGEPFRHVPLIREINRDPPRLCKIDYCTYKPTQKIINVDEDIEGDLKFKPVQNNERSQAAVDLYTRSFFATSLDELRKKFDESHIVLNQDDGLSNDRLADKDGIEYFLNKSSDGICAATKYYKKKSLFFCVDQNHARYTHGLLQQKGVRSECVTSETGQNVKEVADKIRNNELDVIVAVNRVTEGFDLPEIETVFLLRPTRSARIYLQQIGRGLRISKSKDKNTLLIVDIVGNYSKHGKRIVALSLNEVLKNTDGQIIKETFNDELKNAVKHLNVETKDTDVTFSNEEVFSEKDEKMFCGILEKVFPDQIDIKNMIETINTQKVYLFYSDNLNFEIIKDSEWKLYLKVPLKMTECIRDGVKEMHGMIFLGDKTQDKCFSKLRKLKMHISGIRDMIAYAPKKDREILIGTPLGEKTNEGQTNPTDVARNKADEIKNAFMTFMRGEGVRSVDGIEIKSIQDAERALAPYLVKISNMPLSLSDYWHDTNSTINYLQAKKNLHNERALKSQDIETINKYEKSVINYLMYTYEPDDRQLIKPDQLQKIVEYIENDDMPAILYWANYPYHYKKKTKNKRLRFIALILSTKSMFIDAKKIANMINDVDIHDRVSYEICADLILEKKLDEAKSTAIMIFSNQLRKQVEDLIHRLSSPNSPSS